MSVATVLENVQCAMHDGLVKGFHSFGLSNVCVWECILFIKIWSMEILQDTKCHEILKVKKLK